MNLYAVPAVLVAWAVFAAVFGDELVPLWLLAIALACLIQLAGLKRRYER